MKGHPTITYAKHELATTPNLAELRGTEKPSQNLGYSHHPVMTGRGGGIEHEGRQQADAVGKLSRYSGAPLEGLNLR